MTIGDRIKEARKSKGLKQSELAEMVDVTASAIGNYENNVSFPKESVLFKLIDALKVDANYLFQDSFGDLETKKPGTVESSTGQDEIKLLYNIIQLLNDEEKERLIYLAQIAKLPNERFQRIHQMIDLIEPGLIK